MLETRFHGQGWIKLEKWIADRVGSIIKEMRYGDKEWDQPLLKDSRGRALIVDANAASILRNDVEAKDVFAYDVSQGASVYVERPVWYPDNMPFTPNMPIGDADIQSIIHWIQAKYPGYTIRFRELVRVVDDVAIRAKVINPSLDYLRECHAKWIASGRINLLSGPALVETANEIFPGYVQHLVVDDEGKERDLVPLYLLNTYGGLVNRIAKPGCKFDTCLVLAGVQGFNKSKFGENLMGSCYFNQHLSTITNQADIARVMRRKHIGELSELSALRKADLETTKAVITTSMIIYVPKYSNYEKEVGVMDLHWNVKPY